MEKRQHTLGKLSTFLKRVFPHTLSVMDGSIPEQISLIESALEFCRRYKIVEWQEREEKLFRNQVPKNGKEDCNNTTLDSRIDLTTPSIALSSEETRYLLRTKGTNQSNIEANSRSLEAVVETHAAGIDPRMSYLHESAMTNSFPKPIPSPNKVLPMLSSSCPGFVCYVEKSVPNVVPNLCTVKSPMAIAGTIYKHQEVCKQLRLLEQYEIQESKVDAGIKGISNLIDNSNQWKENVYHVAIMPCHDKKLEAERKDLVWNRDGQHKDILIPDVDLVITTSELLDIMIKFLPDLESGISEGDGGHNAENRIRAFQLFFNKLPIDNAICNPKDIDRQVPGFSEVDSSNHLFMGSGGYADFIFRFAAKSLFGFNIPHTEVLPWKKATRRRGIQDPKKPSDYSELLLYKKVNGTYSIHPSTIDCNTALGSDVVVLRFAVAYGFTNIQRVIQRINTGGNKCDSYHFVEVMACPSGCLNGGGQIRDSHNFLNKKATKRESLLEVRTRVEENELYANKPLKAYIPTESQYPTQLLHTKFHVVPKMELSSGATAGVALDNTVW